MLLHRLAVAPQQAHQGRDGAARGDAALLGAAVYLTQLVHWRKGAISAAMVCTSEVNSGKSEVVVDTLGELPVFLSFSRPPALRGVTITAPRFFASLKITEKRRETAGKRPYWELFSKRLRRTGLGALLNGTGQTLMASFDLIFHLFDFLQ
jgi:hypothetical protein